MFAGKPIIGIIGGIGSGKSYVAKLFAELGCLVIDSDQQVREIYQRPAVRETLRKWWGDEVFTTSGEINRSVLGRRVFNNLADKKKLEDLIHPIVNSARERTMSAAAHDAQVIAFIWDTPLLTETGLHKMCDAVVFVDAPRDVRLARVSQNRGWDSAELARRENLQWPLDKKREISDHVLRNTADADDLRGQVREALSRILAKTMQK